MNKREIPNWEQLEWNTGDDWAVPIPLFTPGASIRRRWFVPQETPVIPTGWMYELADGEVVCQFQLVCASP